MTPPKTKSSVMPRSFVGALVCVASLSACSAGGSSGGGEPPTKVSIVPAKGFSPAFYKDDASGIYVHMPSGWNPHPFLGGTIAFSPAPDSGYKARAFIQRQDPAVTGSAAQHLKAAERMLRKKKYATFEVVSREIKSPFGKEFGELIYRHQSSPSDPMLTDSLCVIPVTETRWVILQSSAASSAFDRLAPQFELIKNSLVM